MPSFKSHASQRAMSLIEKARRPLCRALYKRSAWGEFDRGLRLR
jgi:hypothetical protein